MNIISRILLKIADFFYSVEMKIYKHMKTWKLSASEFTKVPTKEYDEMKVYFEYGNEKSMVNAVLIGSIRRLLRNEKTDKISKSSLGILLKEKDQELSTIDKKYKPIIDKLYSNG